MKVAPVSADLLIKLALVAVGVGLVVYGINRAKNAAAALIPDLHLPDIPDAYNPASTSNVVYGAVNSVGDAVVSPTGNGRNADGSWTFGGWIYDVTHPGWADKAIKG